MRDDKAYYYDTIADQWAGIANLYDSHRRLEIVYDELLATCDLTGRTVLDVGCGVGWFSERAARRGARVTSLDIGTRLLARARDLCDTRPVAADACALPFVDDAFDVVVSSECIEHTVDPARALREIHRVTRPGGLMAVTTPNHLWHFAVTLAEVFKLRPYEGYENWLRWGEVRRTLRESGARLETMRGFHLLPPVFSAIHPLLRRLDAWGGPLGPLMVNIAVLART